MPALSFRHKLLAAMMLVVAGVTAATIGITKQRVESTYLRLFTQQSHTLNSLFNSLQVTRLENPRQQCSRFARLVRLQAILRRVNAADADDLAESTERLYLIARDELRAAATGNNPPVFFRFLDASGKTILPPAQFDAGLTDAVASGRLNEQLTVVGRSRGAESQLVGNLPAELDGRQVLLEVIVTKIVDPASGDVLGELAIGFEMPLMVGQGANSMNGIRVENRLYSQSIPEKFREAIVAGITNAMIATGTEAGDFPLPLDDVPHRIFYETANHAAGFPTAGSVFVYSLAEAEREQRDIRDTILGFGGGALLVALVLSFFLANSLSGPIRDIVKGTQQVKQGNFKVSVPVRSKDEVGQLAQSFNEMTRGLAEREKFRAVLDMVTDKAVATELMRGDITLGGETREVSVLFCDIRGFTALTENMNPREVIRILNEHFTPLTKIVAEYNGVVDKFVGDLIMAVFGAPKSYGNDTANAARCALQIIAARRQLNETSSHKIEVGIGVATGKAVAGCMGSNDRLNYTVLGERVNLASRLCGVAGRMEVVIDQTSRERLGDTACVETLPPLSLKGFTGTIAAHKLIGIEPEKKNL